MMKILPFFLFIHISLISLNNFAQENPIPSISTNSSDSLLKDWIDLKNLSFQYQKKHTENNFFIDKVKEDESELSSSNAITQQLESSQKILINQIQQLHPESQQIKEILIIYKEYLELNYQFEIGFNTRHLDTELLTEIKQKKSLLDILQADTDQYIFNYLNQKKPLLDVFLNDWLAYKLMIEKVSSENKTALGNDSLFNSHSNIESLSSQLKESSKNNIQHLRNLKVHNPVIQNQINLRIREYQLLSKSFNLDGIIHEEKVELFNIGNKIEQQEQLLDQDAVKLIQQHLINL